ncbi:MAG TPA: hypothetical protein VFS22_00705 [Flavisolibacter sp.]|nr:hypothetical protein [Flavisolibacter sp.]
MTHLFEPFTPELFKQQTGMDAHDNEAIYLRWVNSQINYANYQNMKSMNESLKEIISLLKEGVLEGEKKYPFTK